MRRINIDGTMLAWLLLGASLVYLFFEILFNVKLLDVASLGDADQASLDRIEFFGRCLSASGLTLLVFGVLAKRNVKLFVLLPFLFSAWFGMYFGQKEAIDRFLIDPSSWKDRLNAQYMQILRTGLRDGVIEIEGAPLRASDLSNPEEKTFLALLGGLVMDDPAFLETVRKRKEELISRIAGSTTSDELETSYALYRKRGEEFQVLWKRYVAASKEYDSAISSASRSADEAWADVLSGIESGYLQYVKARKAFEKQASINAERMAPRLKRYFDHRRSCKTNSCLDRIDSRYDKEIRKLVGKAVPWQFWCESRNPTLDESIEGFERKVSGALSDAVSALFGKTTNSRNTEQAYYQCYTGSKIIVPRVIALTKDRFEKESGYPYFLPSGKYSFIYNPETEKNIRSKSKELGILLPSFWNIDDSAGFISAARRSIVEEIDSQWKDRIREDVGGYVPPRLSYTEFVRSSAVQALISREMGNDYVPVMNFEMSEREFKAKVLDPRVVEKVKNTVDAMENRGIEYGNGGKFEEEGKAYLRSVLVPPISLFLSLFFGLVTLGKSSYGVISLVVLNSSAISRLPGSVRRVIRVVSVVTVISTLVGLPFIVHNKFSESDAFKYFADAAGGFAQWKVVLAEYTIRIQPIVYPVGSWLLSNVTSSIPSNPMEDAIVLSDADGRKVESLLSLAGAAIKENRLLTPANESAVRYYEDALQLDPSNQNALKGLSQVVDRYRLLAEKAVLDGNGRLHRLYIERSEKVETIRARYTINDNGL